MQRKRYTPEFKTKVALEALKAINEIASEMRIHATQITQWKKQAQEGLKEIFADRRGKSQVSNTLDVHFCLDALESDLSRDTRDFQYRPGQPIYEHCFY